MTACRICSNTELNKTHSIREMMYGNGQSFDYIECSRCGCLQIHAVPSCLEAYYPSDYYAHQLRVTLKDPAVLAFLKRQRTGASLGPRNFLNAAVGFFYRPPGYMDWLKMAGVRLDDPILDVGCGAGELLVRLSKDGFSNLTGVEPYIREEVIYPNGVSVLRRTMDQIHGPFGFVMLHHCFEHMADPLQALREVHRLLLPGKVALVRVPVAGSFAWEHYGPYWVQLDAPRHLFLHTPSSMAILAKKAGFRIVSTVFDSDAFQFWGSEQYQMGIALRDPRSFAEGRNPSLFTKRQIRQFNAEARKLNRKNKGDQACFYLLRPGKGDGEVERNQ